VYNVKEALSPFGVTGRVVTTELLLFQNPKSYDLIVFFRCVENVFTTGFLVRCKASGVPTIYDIDDLVFDPRIADQLQALRHLSAIHAAELLLAHKRFMERCDYVTASTQYLCDYISATTAKKAFLIRNGLNREQAEIAAEIDQSDRTECLIGFLSGSNTHDVDFKQAALALEEILNRYPKVKLVVIGPVELPDSIKRFGNRVQRLPYMDYRKLLRTCNRLYAVIVPLEYTSAFCNAKSELKYFEQALVGVPVIASPTAPYRACITHGVNGMLAKDAEEWEKALSRLIEDADFRDTLAKNAKEHIADIYGPKAIGAQANAVYSWILAQK
jgi:glycosyltransferase involved in cell wall biosynthesis